MFRLIRSRFEMLRKFHDDKNFPGWSARDTHIETAKVGVLAQASSAGGNSAVTRACLQMRDQWRRFPRGPNSGSNTKYSTFSPVDRGRCFPLKVAVAKGHLISLSSYCDASLFSFSMNTSHTCRRNPSLTTGPASVKSR